MAIIIRLENPYQHYIYMSSVHLLLISSIPIMASRHSAPIFDEQDDYLIQTSQLSIDSASDADDVADEDESLSPPPMQEQDEKEEWLLDRNPIEGSLEFLGCKLLVTPRGMEKSIAMDIEEIKACRDLGIDFPCDWKVKISRGGFDTSGSSTDVNLPSSDWSISSPGEFKY